MPDFGDGSQREEFGRVDPYAPSVANGQISPAEYARYQAGRRRAALLGILGTIGGTSLASGLTSLLGSAGGGAAGAASGGALPPVAGGAPWAVTPYAGTASMAPTGAAAVGGTVGAGAGMAAGAGGGAASGLLGNLDWRDLAGLGLTGVGVANSFLNRPDNSPNTATSDPQMRELMELMMGRVRKSEPLYDSVLSMANGLLPTQYQKGGGGMG